MGPEDDKTEKSRALQTFYLEAFCPPSPRDHRFLLRRPARAKSENGNRLKIRARVLKIDEPSRKACPPPWRKKKRGSFRCAWAGPRADSCGPQDRVFYETGCTVSYRAWNTPLPGKFLWVSGPTADARAAAKAALNLAFQRNRNI